MNTSVNSWTAAAQEMANVLVIDVHFLRQQRPCVLHYSAYAGPLGESRDYFKKAKNKQLGNLIFLFMFSVFTSSLKANTEPTL